MVKGFLRYISLLVVAAAWAGCLGESDSAVEECRSDNFVAELSVYTFESPISGVALLTPRQLSVATVYRTYTISKRQHNSHRNGCDFVKSGKVINSDIINSTLANSITGHTSSAIAANRLAVLGRLII